MHKFIGRSKEISEIEEILFSPQSEVNVLGIVGPPGIGKTSLSYELYSRRLTWSPRFHREVVLSAYRKEWQDVAVEIGKHLEIPLAAKANLQEVVDQIERDVTSSRTFLFIDNIDNDAELCKFLHFCGRLGGGPTRILFTSRVALDRERLPRNCSVYKLKGFEEDWVVREIAGQELMKQVDEWGLQEEIELLQGHPQRLLYLRWRAAHTREEVTACIRDLLAGSEGLDAVGEVLRRLSPPALHFMAMGRVRTPDIEENFLAYLWDQLNLGSTREFMESVRLLEQERLLEVLGDHRIRISAPVHVQLEKELVSAVGDQQLRAIDYFIGEFFRRRLTERLRSVGDLDLDDLEAYVYHMARSGNVRSAYSYVFLQEDTLSLARARGVPREIERVLLHFDEELARTASRADPPTWGERALRANVKAELGRVYKDLSEHRKSLEVLTLAERLGGGVEDEEMDAELARKILHYKAIAYSQIGDTEACIEAYSQSIEVSLAEGRFKSTDCLSLGYLAYELKFHRMDESLRLGKKAVEFAEAKQWWSVLSKNLCSLGQIQSFSGMEIADSVQTLERAEQTCRDHGGDRRELGRIFVNSAVTFIGLGDLPGARRSLDAAQEAFEESGDRRRRAMGTGYEGICRFHEGLEARAHELVEEALERHCEIGALREAIYEARVLDWMEMRKGRSKGGPPESGQAHEASRRLQEALDHTNLRGASKGNVEVFLRFWERYYGPVLLEQRFGQGSG